MNRCGLIAMIFTLAAAFPAPARAKPDPEPLVDLASEAFESAGVTETGQRFTLRMGRKRVNWNNARWSVLAFEKPRDLGAFNAIRLVVSTDEPRSDAGVYLGLKEADGTWYVHGWAANLTQKKNVGLARFEDFCLPVWYAPPGGNHHDENACLDPEKIGAVAIGCVNPLGIGEVAFTLEELSLVALPKEKPKPVEVEVTGKLLDVNGTRAVPAGLFGTFAQRNKENMRKYRMGMDRHLWGKPGPGDEITHMQINTYGERTQVSIRLNDPNWEANVAKAARSFAQAAKATGRQEYAEFWNEPYLNWANRNRINFNPRFYDRSRAKEGGPVHIKHDGQVAPHLKWTRNFDAPPWNWCRSLQEWRRGRDEKGTTYSPVHAMPYNRRNWQPNMHPPDDVKDGQTYTVSAGGRELALTAFTPWHVYDQTQFTYWSAGGMLKFYIEPMLVYGKTLKAEAPEVMFIVGWGNRPSEDHWAGWNILYRPTLDAGIKLVDGIHDHDYGSDPLKMAANYEVVQAYSMGKYNKWLYFYNTEQGAQVDPQAYPEAGALSRGTYADLGKFRWAIRKMLHALRYVPDKARSFAHFGHWWSDNGEGVMFDLLKNLRGKLVQVVCDDPSVYAVACIDGTDPLNPRPADMPQRKELVVAILNDHPEPREVNLTIAAPTGTRFTRQAIARRQVIDKQSGNPAAAEMKLKWTAARPDRFGYRETLEPRSAVVLTLPLEGDVAQKPEVRRRQFFADAVLEDVTSGRPVRTKIAVDSGALKRAERAWIRFVAERLGPGEGVVTLNGKHYPLPHAVTPENAPWIRQFAVDPADLKADNSLVFTVASPNHAGYLLGAASLMVEGD